MEIAFLVSTRSTCLRKKVGAVIIDSKSKTIISTGYNGSLPSADHCIDVGCNIVNKHCTRTVHAETNAITHASRIGANLFEKTIYCTCKPCWNCFKNIISAGINTIYYKENYVESNIDLYEKYLLKNPNLLLKQIK